LIGNLFDLAEGDDSTFKTAGVPEDDRDEDVQTGRPIKPVDEDRPSQAVARLTFVEFAAGPACHVAVNDGTADRDGSKMRPSQTWGAHAAVRNERRCRQMSR